MIISLTGFMGCGKSSVGRELSRLLCCPFMDLDSVIEEKSGRKIPEIFATDGEAAFRQMEVQNLKFILDTQDINQCAPLAPSHSVGPSPYAGVRKCQLRTHGLHPELHQNLTKEIQGILHNDQHLNSVVLALGGGTVMTQECAEMVQKKTVCVYLRATSETLAKRLEGEADSRPLLTMRSLRGAEQRDNLPARIEELLSERCETYEQTAHMVIDTDGKTIEEIASEILKSI